MVRGASGLYFNKALKGHGGQGCGHHLPPSLQALGQKAEVSGWSFTQIGTLFHFHDLFTCYSYTVAGSDDVPWQLSWCFTTSDEDMCLGIQHHSEWNPVGLMHRGILIHTWQCVVDQQVRWVLICRFNVCSKWKCNCQFVLKFQQKCSNAATTSWLKLLIVFTPELCGIQN